MEINQQIRDLLDSFGINQEDGLSYLLSVYFECRPSYTPTILIQKINATNILGIGASRELIWNIPLFVASVETDGKWDWVKTWNGLFGAINSKRKGSDKDCITRMKKFFAEKPEVRKEDVIGATQLYFSSLTDRQYLTSSHYFIFKGVGRDKLSALAVWVERYQQEMSEIPEYTGEDLSTKMQ